MKVLHVLYSNRFSGAENVVCQIIGMFRNDADVEMVYCSPDGQIREALKERNITFVPLKKFSKKELKRVIKEQKPDIIHAHDYRAGIVSCLSKKKIKTVLHLHNDPPWIKRVCVRSLIAKTLCEKYDVILTVSECVMREFVFGKRYNEKTICIGNPINFDEIVDIANGEDFFKSYDVCFIGRFVKQKNPLLFIDIISELKNTLDVSAVMLGNGRMKKEIIKKVNQRSLSENIDLLGFVEYRYGVLKNCRVLCVPSKWEGFGLVSIEALALGVPVICANVGGLPNIVDNYCGKVCNSKKEYTDEISRLLHDKTYYEYKRKNAILKAKKLNNINQYYKNLRNVYESVMGE